MQRGTGLAGENERYKNGCHTILHLPFGHFALEQLLPRPLGNVPNRAGAWLVSTWRRLEGAFD